MLFRDKLQIRLLTGSWTCLTSNIWKNIEVRSYQWCLYYNEKSGAYIQAKGKVYALKAKTIYILPKWLTLRAWCTQPTGHLYIHFDVAGVSQKVIDLLFSDIVELAPSQSLKTELSELTKAFKASHQSTYKDYCKAQIVILKAMEHVFSCVQKKTMERITLSNGEWKRILPAVEYIEAHLNEPIINKHLASLCYMEEDYFIRRFRSAVGKTPVQFTLEKRIQQAAELLLESELSIDQIAENCGFGNRFYFSRIFKRFLLKTPAAYRREFC